VGPTVLSAPWRLPADIGDSVGSEAEGLQGSEAALRRDCGVRPEIQALPAGVWGRSHSVAGVSGERIDDGHLRGPGTLLNVA
jgi:hypothetical protein